MVEHHSQSKQIEEKVVFNSTLGIWVFRCRFSLVCYWCFPFSIYVAKFSYHFLRFRKSGIKKKGQNNVASFKVGFSSLLLPEESLDPKKERKFKEQDRSLVRAAFPAASACLKVTSYPDPNTPADGTNSQLLPGKTRRSKTLLTLDEENKLANHLIELRKQGYAKTKETILFMATQMASKRGHTVAGGCLSYKWWKGFEKRNPQVLVESSRGLGANQMMEALGLFYRGLLTSLTNSQYGSLVGDRKSVV